MGDLLTKDGVNLLDKDDLMEKLGDFSNLMEAVSAIKYVRHVQATLIPIIFQKWKELSFEGRAKRLRQLVSNSHSHAAEAEARSQKEEQSGRSDLENYFFRDHGAG